MAETSIDPDIAQSMKALEDALESMGYEPGSSGDPQNEQFKRVFEQAKQDLDGILRDKENPKPYKTWGDLIAEKKATPYKMGAMEAYAKGDGWYRLEKKMGIEVKIPITHGMLGLGLKMQGFNETLLKNMDGVLRFLENSDELLMAMEAVDNYVPPAPQSVDVKPSPSPMPSESESSSSANERSIGRLEWLIGQEPNGKWEDTDREALQAYLINAQKTLGWAGDQDGIYSTEFREHLLDLSMRLDQIGELSAQMVSFLDDAKKSGIELSPKAHLPSSSNPAKGKGTSKVTPDEGGAPANEKEASKDVKDSAKKPPLKEQPKMTLEEATLFAKQAMITIGGPMGLPVPKTAEGDFGEEANLSLQKMLEGLRGPNAGLKLDKSVEDIPHWQYTPELGAELNKALKANKQISGLLTSKKIDPDKLILAFDTLHENKKLSMAQVIDPETIPQLADLHRKILLEGARRVAKINPAATPLNNEFVRYFSGGFGFKEFLPNQKIEGMVQLSNQNPNLKTRMQTLFGEALRGAEGDLDKLGAQINSAAKMISALPFGKDSRGPAFEELIKKTFESTKEAYKKLDETGRKDPQKMEELSILFASGFVKGMDDVNAQHGHTEFKRKSTEVTVDPRQIAFKIEGGAGEIDVNDVIDAYNAHNKNKSSIYSHDPLVFKGPDGKTYLAAVDHIQSNIFTIVELPMKEMQEFIKKNAPSGEERTHAQGLAFVEQMKEEFPVYRLAQRNYAAMSAQTLVALGEEAENFSQTMGDIEQKNALYAQYAQIEAAKEENDPVQVVKLDRGALDGAVPYEKSDDRKIYDIDMRYPAVMKDAKITINEDKRVLLSYTDSRTGNLEQSDITRDFDNYMKDRSKSPEDIQDYIEHANAVKGQIAFKNVVYNDNQAKRNILGSPQIEVKEGRALVHYANRKTREYETLDITEELARYVQDNPKHVGAMRAGENPKEYVAYVTAHQRAAAENYPQLSAISQFYAGLLGQPLLLAKHLVENGDITPGTLAVKERSAKALNVKTVAPVNKEGLTSGLREAALQNETMQDIFAENALEMTNDKNLDIAPDPSQLPENDLTSSVSLKSNV